MILDNIEGQVKLTLDHHQNSTRHSQYKIPCISKMKAIYILVFRSVPTCTRIRMCVQLDTTIIVISNSKT